jgi:D-glycero-alpha-D-manno-heptose-7-phosphate kinase
LIMQFEVKAPNRIDLAGGTTDLYPLYLLMEGGCTINAAVTVSSKVIVRSTDRHGITLISEDLQQQTHAESAFDLPLDGPLGLVGRAVRAIPPSESIEIVTKNDAPAGSGLGASSALLVGLLSALMKIDGMSKSRREIVNLATSIETANIGVPAGQQDYIAAAYGGISVLEFGYSGFSRQPVPSEESVASMLEETIILSYTGLTRFSGMNNWEVVKSFVDGNEEVRKKLIQIRNIASRLGDELPSGNIEKIGKLIDQEWQIRRTLAPGVITDQISIIMRSAADAGALASKVCGAGGGGCMITVTHPEKQNQVEGAITHSGGTIIPFKIDREGVRIEQN